MTVFGEQAEQLRIVDPHAGDLTTGKEKSQTEVDIHRLAEQLQDLQQRSRRYISDHHANGSSGAVSTAYSDDGSQGNDSTGRETPPTLAASSCPTPTRDSVCEEFTWRRGTS